MPAQPLVGQVPEELDRLRDLYRKRQPVRVLEIGVWHGGTLREWLAETPEVVVAVDPDPQVTDYDVGDHTQFVLVVGRSQEDHVRDQIREHAPYDWVFIDGDHEYSAVKADTEPHFAGGNARQPSILQFLRCAMHECESRHHDAASEGCEGCRTAQSFRGHCGIQNTKAGAAEAFRYH